MEVGELSESRISADDADDADYRIGDGGVKLSEAGFTGFIGFSGLRERAMNGFPTTNRRAKVRSRESEFPPTKRDYPILTISAVVLFSRSLERSYPRSASSKKRVASASFLSELPKIPISCSSASSDIF